MQATGAFLLAVVVSLLSSTIILAVILRPLRQVLAELCERGSGARFWSVFSGLMLYLTPLLITVYAYSPDSVEPTLFVVRRAIMATLFAAVIALLMIGWQIARQVPLGRPRDS